MANSYITLANSNGSLSKRFFAKSIDYAPVTREQTIDETLGGNWSIVHGRSKAVHKYTLMVAETAPNSTVGSVANLATFFGYNNPNGTPSDVITYTDIWGNSHSAYIQGNMSGAPMGKQAAGTQALFTIDITLLIKP